MTKFAHRTSIQKNNRNAYFNDPVDIFPDFVEPVGCAHSCSDAFKGYYYDHREMKTMKMTMTC
jgi:hypothetical protein